MEKIGPDRVSSLGHKRGQDSVESRFEETIDIEEPERIQSFVPALGQSFASFKEIEILLDGFAEANCFMIIIMRSQRPGGKVVQATFGCYKSGSYRPNRIDPPNKRTIKTNCPFQINVRYSEKNNEYRITKVDLEHNHELNLSDVKPSILNRSVRRRSITVEESNSKYDVSKSHFKRSKQLKDKRIKCIGSLESSLLLPFCEEELDILPHQQLDLDLLSGLELPDDIAQEVSASMAFGSWNDQRSG
jgi:hypothetical protein